MTLPSPMQGQTPKTQKSLGSCLPHLSDHSPKPTDSIPVISSYLSVLSPKVPEIQLSLSSVCPKAPGLFLFLLLFPSEDSPGMLIPGSQLPKDVLPNAA